MKKREYTNWMTIETWRKVQSRDKSSRLTRATTNIEKKLQSIAQIKPITKKGVRYNRKWFVPDLMEDDERAAGQGNIKGHIT